MSKVLPQLQQASASQNKPHMITNWADINELEDDTAEVDGLVAYDQDGNRLITTYYREADGRQMKCERKVAIHRKVCRVPIAIRERHSRWKKFGIEALDFEKGDNKKFATFANEKEEILSAPRRLGLLSTESQDEQFVAVSNSNFEINRKLLSDIQKLFNSLANPDAKQLLAFQVEKEESINTSAIPDRGFSKSIETEDRTIRVTNLPEYTDEENLRKLFNRCGTVQRFFLAKNKETDVSKGFAFITYRTRQEAENAIKKLHKVGFQNVLLNVEWARKKTVALE